MINVTGGEPLLRKDLFEVMTYANKLGFHWGMTTNGIQINDEIIEKMKSSGMDTISISIDGLKDTHNEFRGVSNSYERIIENVEKLKKANFLDWLQITTVINKTNINELEELYSVMKDLNINSWRILSIEPIGRANENEDLLLKKDDYEKLLTFIRNKRRISKFDIKFSFKFIPKQKIKHLEEPVQLIKKGLKYIKGINAPNVKTRFVTQEYKAEISISPKLFIPTEMWKEFDKQQQLLKNLKGKKKKRMKEAILAGNAIRRAGKYTLKKRYRPTPYTNTNIAGPYSGGRCTPR